MFEVQVDFVKMPHAFSAPTRATEGSAAFDFYAAQDGILWDGEQITIETGIKVSMPKGFGLFMFSRSGMGFNHGVNLANCVGVIDSDYRGQILVALRKGEMPANKPCNFEIKRGMRIAQGIIMALPSVHWHETDKLDETERGENGGGSTGA